jgi:ABC-type amino acid transport substrate-binding protein
LPLLANRGIATLRQLSATVVPFKNADEAVAALESGKADAFASDKLPLVGAIPE